MPHYFGFGKHREAFYIPNLERSPCGPSGAASSALGTFNIQLLTSPQISSRTRINTDIFSLTNVLPWLVFT